jgi:hypothetical protein
VHFLPLEALLVLSFTHLELRTCPWRPSFEYFYLSLNCVLEPFAQPLEVAHLVEETSLFGFDCCVLEPLKQPLEVAHLVEALHCLGLLACCVVVIFS